MNSVALEVRDLVKSFSLDGATINAVDGVSFQVKSGEFVALVGPSGSGKTTMLSILAALLTPTTGQVLIDGQDLAQMNEKKRVKLRREKIGFTFQSNNLIPYLTARENVEFMLRLNNKMNCWRALGWPTVCTTSPPKCPADSSSALRLPVR